MAIYTDEHWTAGAVRVRAKAIDPFEGLRGHAYIQARGLCKPPVRRIDADKTPSPLFLTFTHPVQS